MGMQVSAARDPGSAGPRPLDELDRSIVQALQIHPRAPWTLVGEVLGVNPVTAARRWQRLERAGLAWVTAYARLSDPRIVVTGVIEIDTDPGYGEDVAEALGGHREVVNVKLTAGGRDLVVSVQAGALEELAGFVSGLFRTMPGVRATRTHVATAVPTEGSRWRLRSLDATQRALLERALSRTVPTRGTGHGSGSHGTGTHDSGTHDTGSPGGGRHGAGPHSRDELDTRLAELLGANGRMSVPDLADATGAGLTTVRRRLRTLLDSSLRLRCDLARPLSGWPQSVVYFASVPAQHLDETVRLLSAVPEVRSCSITAGPHNVVLDVWLRTLADVHTFEAHLAQRLPRLAISDRSVVLRTTKHMGRLLDRDGACVGVVPLPHYADTPPRTA
ncbi:Lrp/AsnC family transcriptional regulator [Streptomyces sp. NPDC096310]|uniref:Lrp/AsnC family transcriptional regulator n=1 Tax=Streptomyces sp. NPDC096310 TaxID=3366082 RepID=UPI00382D7451